MKDFFKYLTVAEEDKDWGLYLKAAGRAIIPPQAVYPSAEHPTGYYFSWTNGRVLQEFQLNFISEGSGLLENDFGKFIIKPGTIMITRPGVWHRYRPTPNTGWVENYIGFDGPLARGFLNKSVFSSNVSAIHCGFQEELIDTYAKIYDLVQRQDPGFQQIGSGMVLKLLGQTVAFTKRRNFSGKPIEQVIRKARFYMSENIESGIDLHQFAKTHHTAYSHLRKMFKKYTGISPHQYYLDLKLMRAREMIVTTEKSIKEISFELGFDSIHYFSRLFKKKVGTNPTELRKTTAKIRPISK